MLLFNFKHVILVAHPTGVQGVRNAVLIQGLRSCRGFDKLSHRSRLTPAYYYVQPATQVKYPHRGLSI